MKKNLFLAALAAAVVMTGCSSNEVFDNAVTNEQDAMQFTPVVGKQTRAGEIKSADLQVNGTTLKLYGYKTNNEFANRNSGTFAQFFANAPEELKYNGGWSASKTYEWLSLSTDYLSVFSYYAPKDGITSITAPAKLTAGKFDYTVPNTIDAQEDLLVSANLNMTKVNSNGIIAINFKHALSQLYFQAKLADTGYKAVIKGIKVKGAKNRGTFTYAESGTTVGTWGTVTGTYNYVYAENLSQAITRQDVADRIGTNGSLMLMPQAVNADNFQFEVTYDVYDTTAGTEKLIGANIVKSADMAALEMGKKYIYTLVLTATENDNIVFSVTVDDWDAADATIQREVRFDNYRLTTIAANDQTAIANLITGYTPSVIYLQEVKVTATDALAGALTIDLTSLSTNAVTGSKVILDCTGVSDFDSKTIAVTVPNDWTADSSSLNNAGKITITKNQ